VLAGAPPLPFHAELDVFRAPEAQRAAVADIAADPSGCAFVAEQGGRTVGYVTFHPPGDLETWGEDRSGRLVELGAIEVAPSLRGERLGERLLEAAFADGRFDDTVVFATLYVWHYDLARTGLGPFAYRRLLEKLYRKADLVAKPTSDPEIRSDGANALVARIGPKAPEEVVREFDRIRVRPSVGV
jgi:acetoin utilization protein AcuA